MNSSQNFEPQLKNGSHSREVLWTDMNLNYHGGVWTTPGRITGRPPVASAARRRRLRHRATAPPARGALRTRGPGERAAPSTCAPEGAGASPSEVSGGRWPPAAAGDRSGEEGAARTSRRRCQPTPLRFESGGPCRATALPAL